MRISYKTEEVLFVETVKYLQAALVVTTLAVVV